MAKNNSDIRFGWFPAASFLLVDDDQEHLEMLDRSLSGMGFATQAVADGEEAVAFCRQERFDVVIADIQMPRMDGFELLRIIKKEYEEIDVVLMTGFSRTYTFTDVIRGGATDYLEKPFTRDALRAKIFRILKERALLAGYNRELAQRREMEATLQRKSADLEKRVRELNCLYRVSGIMEEKKRDLTFCCGRWRRPFRRPCAIRNVPLPVFGTTTSPVARPASVRPPGHCGRPSVPGGRKWGRSKFVMTRRLPVTREDSFLRRNAT
ncbi:MAG: response regulator [Thermodesulfobacteriota bacterium]